MSAIQSGSWFQLSEFQFIGTTTDESNFTVIKPLNGSGTAESPYTISNESDWNAFAAYVNDGISYSGKYVRLTQDINVSTVVGYRNSNTDGKPFCGTFLGDGHTITATLTDDGKSGLAPFRYVKNATIKDVKVAGTIASNQYHSAGLVGFADGTNQIEDCVVTATLNVNNNYAGGIIGHGLNSATTIKNSVFAGTINGVGGNRSNIGGIWGWCDNATPTLENCLEAGTYTNIASMHPMGLQSGKGTITNCYYVTPQIGSPDNACTVSGATQVSAALPDNEISKKVTADGNDYYALCKVGTVKPSYLYTGSDINVARPTVTAHDGTMLAEGKDYTVSFSPETVKDKGTYTMTLTGTGNYCGQKTLNFVVAEGTAFTADMATLTDGIYVVNQDVTISSRITISGTVTLILGEGTTLTAPKGIELSAGNTLYIEGPGALTINNCDNNKSGIGASRVGTLVINGGIINTHGSSRTFYGGAGIGGDYCNTDGGTITINGGVVNATGGGNAAGIGGGYNYWEKGACGVCGDVTINGGQVTAIGQDGAQGIGVGQVYCQSAHYSGSLKLSWTSPDDFVYSNNFASVNHGSSIQSITIADGKQFIIAGTQTTVDNTTKDLAAALSGKTIWGYNYNRPIALTDNDTYIRGADLPVSSATYTKTIGEERVGKRQAWLVPFDYTITADDAEKFTFYKIYMIANAIAPDATISEDIWMYVRPMQEGDVLHANMPYIYKPKDTVIDYVFTADNNLLKAKATDACITMMTSEDTYTLYGTYEPTTATAADPFYYMNTESSLSLGTTVTVGAFRWIMRVESKFGQASQPAYAPRRILIYDGEGSEATGISNVSSALNADGAWYTLDGRRLNAQPSQRGVYINNGNKVVIK